jgi:CheY-like chemotaxis protein
VNRPELLLVDDDDLFREVAADALTRAIPEAAVNTASNGREAIERIEQSLPTVLITDLRMPILDGFGVLSFLARRKATIPVVVLSAFFTPELENRAVGAGAVHCMEKPVDVAKLVTRVRTLLDSKSTGHVAGVTPPGFAQLLQMERQNVTLRVDTPERCGLLHLTDGELTDAWDGRLSGDEAVLNIFSWRGVTMDVVAPRISDRKTVTTSMMFLIMESARRADESNQRAESPTKPRSRPPTAKSFLNLYIDPGSDVGLQVEPVVSGEQTPSTSRDPEKSPRVSSTTNINTTRNSHMTAISKSLDAVMAIDGTIGVALCDWTSGLNLGVAGGNARINVENAGALNCEVVRAKMNAMDALGIKGSIEDILITLEDQYHLIRPLRNAPTLFLYVAIDRAKGNLGLARMKLQQIEKNLEV